MDASAKAHQSLESWAYSTAAACPSTG